MVVRLLVVLFKQAVMHQVLTLLHDMYLCTMLIDGTATETCIPAMISVQHSNAIVADAQTLVFDVSVAQKLPLMSAHKEDANSTWNGNGSLSMPAFRHIDPHVKLSHPVT